MVSKLVVVFMLLFVFFLVTIAIIATLGWILWHRYSKKINRTKDKLGKHGRRAQKRAWLK
jgi:DNA-binding transcriptional regulator of glucitol operon